VTLLYRALRPLLFRLDAERAHRWLLGLAARLGRWFVGRRQQRTLQGVGVAAGLIKDPKHLPAAALLGADFAEVGTLTRYVQAGNRPPRLFRLPRDRAIVNRMGFNNPGYHAALATLLRDRSPLSVGINLGKGKRTPNRALYAELAEGVQLFARVADFFVINVSSPNTPGLRALLAPEVLDDVLRRLRTVADRAARFWGRPHLPLLLKLHPDLGEAEQALLSWLPNAAIDGVVAVNTTVARGGLQSADAHVDAAGDGGLSGAPLAASRDRLVRAVRTHLGPERMIIAAGGIDSAAQARAAWTAGADVLEVYTGLIYAGPGLVRRLRRLSRAQA